MDAALVVPATQLHIGPHVAHLTPEDRAAIERASGMSPRRWLRRFLQESCYCRAGILDGVPVAMWGVMGTIMSSSGAAWLSVTPEARARPHLVARVARREAVNLRSKELQSMLLCGDDRAHRFLRFLGFEISEEMTTESGKMFRSAVLKRTSWTQ